MANHSLSKWKPVIDLRVRSHMAFAVHLVRTLRRSFGGRVDLQKDLLAELQRTDHITNGAAHAMIEALATKGFLRVDRWGPARRYKRLVVVREPGDGLVRIRSVRRELPSWAWDHFPGPPNHRTHLVRHLALAAKFGWGVLR